MFETPSGSYSLNPSKSGASITPDVVNLNNLSSDVVQAFSCTAGCAAPTTIVPGKELVIIDPTVVHDARASNATDGPWSFRFLMEQMTPVGMDPADFLESWVAESVSPPPPNQKMVNGFPVKDRSGLRALWHTRPDGKIDPAQPPFRLLAIVNRVDLHATTNGEVRFVYGLTRSPVFGIDFPFPSSMTVIFEFDMVPIDPNTHAVLTRQSWAAKFHALSSKTFGVDFNPALQAVTDLVTRQNASPSGPNGSAILTVRTNESAFGGPSGDSFPDWELREFHLAPGGTLHLSTTHQNPADAAHDVTTPANAALTSFLNTDGTRIQVGLGVVPPEILGGQATAVMFWNAFGAPVDSNVRRAFAGQTCGGCHLTEIQGRNIDELYRVSPAGTFTSDDPTGLNGPTRLSDFETLTEIPRRAIFAQNQLTCTGAACAVGSDAILHPAP